MSTQQTATQIGLSIRTLQRLADLPRVKLSARCVGYREADVRRWVRDPRRAGYLKVSGPDARSMSVEQYRAAKAELLRPTPAPAPVFGKHVSEMTTAEIMAFEAAVGMRRSHSKVQKQRAAVEAERIINRGNRT